jgi:hypothetical protein
MGRKGEAQERLPLMPCSSLGSACYIGMKRKLRPDDIVKSADCTLRVAESEPRIACANSPALDKNSAAQMLAAGILA